MDVTEITHSGKNYWGLVFYDVKSKLLAYYILGFKYPTTTLNLDALGQLISEHGIPRQLITDIHSVLGAGKQWKQVPGRKITPLLLSKTDKHNQNPVECDIQKLKAGVSKIINACGTGVGSYEYEMM